MVVWISGIHFNFTGERTWFSFRHYIAIRIFNRIRFLRWVNILTSYDRPCTNFTSAVASPVDVNTICLFKGPVWPCTKLSITNILTVTLGSSGVTIVGNHLEPYLRNNIAFVLQNLKFLKFNGSSGCTRLYTDKTIAREQTIFDFPFYLSEIITGRNSHTCFNKASPVTKLSIHIDSSRSLNRKLNGISLTK